MKFEKYFIGLLILLSAGLLNGQDKQPTCNTAILQAYSLTGLTTPNKVNVLCPNINWNCCSEMDQLIIHKQFNTSLQKALEDRYKKNLPQYIKTIKAVNQSKSLNSNQLITWFNQHVKPPADFSAKLEKAAANLRVASEALTMAQMESIKEPLEKLNKKVHKAREGFYCIICDAGNHGFIDSKSHSISLSQQFCASLIQANIEPLYVKYPLMNGYLLALDLLLDLLTNEKLFAAERRVVVQALNSDITKCKTDRTSLGCEALCKDFYFNKSHELWDGDHSHLSQINAKLEEYITKLANETEAKAMFEKRKQALEKIEKDAQKAALDSQKQSSAQNNQLSSAKTNSVNTSGQANATSQTEISTGVNSKESSNPPGSISGQKNGNGPQSTNQNSINSQPTSNQNLQGNLKNNPGSAQNGQGVAVASSQGLGQNKSTALEFQNQQNTNGLPSGIQNQAQSGQTSNNSLNQNNGSINTGNQGNNINQSNPNTQSKTGNQSNNNQSNPNTQSKTGNQGNNNNQSNPNTQSNTGNQGNNAKPKTMTGKRARVLHHYYSKRNSRYRLRHSRKSQRHRHQSFRRNRHRFRNRVLAEIPSYRLTFPSSKHKILRTLTRNSWLNPHPRRTNVAKNVTNPGNNQQPKPIAKNITNATNSSISVTAKNNTNVSGIQVGGPNYTQPNSGVSTQRSQVLGSGNQFGNMPPNGQQPQATGSGIQLPGVNRQVANGGASIISGNAVSTQNSPNSVKSAQNANFQSANTNPGESDAMKRVKRQSFSLFESSTKVSEFAAKMPGNYNIRTSSKVSSDYRLHRIKEDVVSPGTFKMTVKLAGLNPFESTKELNLTIELDKLLAQLFAEKAASSKIMKEIDPSIKQLLKEVNKRHIEEFLNDNGLMYMVYTAASDNEVKDRSLKSAWNIAATCLLTMISLFVALL